MNPSSSTTFTEANRTPGATPVMPRPSSAAAIVPATCVPCADALGLHALRDWSGLPDRQPADRVRSTAAARSGWVASMPESNTPTSTSGLPRLIVRACGAWMSAISHCSADRSVPSAGAASGTRAAVRGTIGLASSARCGDASASACAL